MKPTDKQKGEFLHHQSRSIRTFIGAREFEESRAFYKDLGFQESKVSDDMSYFCADRFGFYLQRYFVKDWVDNSMLFFEVEDVEAMYQYLRSLDLVGRYKGVRLTPIKVENWGKECFLHDPSGVLWHIGEFAK